ncbi:MAG TPA: carboxypeptidase-like regulatory domain-containing protein, partial [Blastocatellia bacterium]|nr:carboxypeptidase-like regulatory domain-containing protein [Blastocatellia bacterium]
MRINRLTIASLVAMIVAIVSQAYAQTDRGAITGRVTDPNGALVTGARITATNADTGDVREAVTTAEGTFT